MRCQYGPCNHRHGLGDKNYWQIVFSKEFKFIENCPIQFCENLPQNRLYDDAVDDSSGNFFHLAAANGQPCIQIYQPFIQVRQLSWWQC